MLKFIARSLLGSIFVVGGYSAVKAPGGRTKAVEKAAGVVGVTLDESEAATVVKLNGAAMLGAGTTLALGILPRTSAVTLIASLLPTTVAGHPFWEETDPASRAGQRTQFLKNLAIVGGLILVAGRRKGSR